MNDHLESLKTYSAWVRGEVEIFDASAGLFQAIDAAIEEIGRLRVNERASIATVQRWAAERVEMVDRLEMMRLKLDHCDEQSKQLGEVLAEIQRLRKLATCGCGDEFTEHDPGTCGNCIAGMRK